MAKSKDASASQTTEGYAPEALIQAVQKLEKRVNKVDERSAKAEVAACDMTDSVGKVENEVITLKGQLGELDNRLEEVSLDAQSLADQAFEKMMGEMAKMREEFTGELLALKKENELLKEELTSLKRTTMAGGATIQVGPKEGRSNGSKGKGGGAKPTDRSSTNSNKTVKKDKAKGSSSSSSSSDKPNNRGCYLCGGPHWARDCPGRQKLSAIIASGGESSGDDAQMGSLRLFSSVRATPKAEESTKVVQVSTLPRPKGSLMFVDTLVNGRASEALVDCGASHNFITEKEAMKLGIKYTKEPGRIKTVNTSPVPILGVAHKVPICLGQWSGTINLTVVHMDDFSLVLGLEFIDTVRPFSFEADGSIMIKRDQGSWSVPVTREEVEAKTISAIQVSRGIKKGQETFLAALVDEEEPHGNEVPSEISGVLVEYKDNYLCHEAPVISAPTLKLPSEIIGKTVEEVL
uniref:Uncharacterized protein n=1 Tax=Chenopodium quinoa TaxID=63459 RepID=A0A803LVV6_CHEQI